MQRKDISITEAFNEAKAKSNQRNLAVRFPTFRRFVFWGPSQNDGCWQDNVKYLTTLEKFKVIFVQWSHRSPAFELTINP